MVCLHGLAGYAGEWEATAAGLAADHRLLALDQRGHGRSDRHPDETSREAFVADVAHLIDELDLAPAVLIGQSMGGNTAFLTAARHPELVAALVVVEASPDEPAPDLSQRIERWLDRWPTPFASPEQAHAFFASEGLDSDAWTAGLERRTDGLWPPFDPAVIVECIADLASRDYWAEWNMVRCPTLIVRGERGNFTVEHFERLARALTAGETATIPHAGHDLHLENPGTWLLTLRQFLERQRSI